LENKINNFTDLVAYKTAHVLVLKIYKAVKHFPAEERFALGNQMRRSAVSITSNIAEGFSRNTAKDKSQFYAMAKGSATELHSQALVAKDLLYITEFDYKDLENDIINTIKLLSGLIKSARNHF
jgi:four helix bundle protein